MRKYGYVRVAGSNTSLKVGDTVHNTNEIKKQVNKAIESQVDIISFSELSITGYTCADLFLHETLLQESLKSISELVDFSDEKDIVFIVGSPIVIDNQLFNMAIVIEKGKILGMVPKTYIPNYNEFYEKRWFTSGKNLKRKIINFSNQDVPCGIDLIFKSDKYIFGVEICEDLWSVSPPSDALSKNGANIIFNLSASNELIGKQKYRHDLVRMQSSKTISAYIYISSNASESSTDLLFGGSSMIYENGTLLKEGKRFSFEGEIIYADVDVDKLINDRVNGISLFEETNSDEYREIKFELSDKKQILSRKYEETPFVPKDEKIRKERCEEILNIQSSALAKRMLHTGIHKTVIGLSGGLDSTLAFLVIIKANEKLNIDNSNIIAITMPGFGTTGRTYKNAQLLAKVYGVTLREVDIKQACLQHFKDINHDYNIHDVTYENVQARERTQILMDVANKESALVIGTGDLSELALGWCTYNGDHMSMYSVNSSIPKTLVKYIVDYVKDTDERSYEVLKDILETPISPELLPPDEKGDIVQKTEDKIGPYKLHDFFLYHFIRNKFSPKKIFELSKITFEGEYGSEEILKWLKVFIKRFFTQQFKRSCMPDGVKVGSVSLSPRGDLRMPSDASYNIWLKELED